MTRMVKFLFALGLLAALGACAEKVGEGYTVKVATAQVSKDVDTGFWPSLDGVSDEDKALIVAEQIEAVLQEDVLGYSQGPLPAILQVEITQINVASGAGRVLATSDSTMVAHAVLVDMQTGAVVAEKDDFLSVDLARRTSFLAKLNPLHLVAGGLIANVDNASSSTLIENLSSDMAIKLKEWLVAL